MDGAARTGSAARPGPGKPAGFRGRHETDVGLSVVERDTRGGWIYSGRAGIRVPWIRDREGQAGRGDLFRHIAVHALHVEREKRLVLRPVFVLIELDLGLHLVDRFPFA